MILLFLSIILAFIACIYLFLGINAPLFIAALCLVVGGFVVLSRLLAWATGAAQRGYSIADSQPIEFRARMKNGMVVMELLLWSLGVFNIWFFVSRF